VASQKVLLEKYSKHIDEKVNDNPLIKLREEHENVINNGRLNAKYANTTFLNEESRSNLLKVLKKHKLSKR
jgi:hypothetical protein